MGATLFLLALPSAIPPVNISGSSTELVVLRLLVVLLFSVTGVEETLEGVSIGLTIDSTAAVDAEETTTSAGG